MLQNSTPESVLEDRKFCVKNNIFTDKFIWKLKIFFPPWSLFYRGNVSYLYHIKSESNRNSEVVKVGVRKLESWPSLKFDWLFTAKLTMIRIGLIFQNSKNSIQKSNKS